MKLLKYLCLCLVVPLGAAEEPVLEVAATDERPEFTLQEISDRVRGHSELIQAQRLRAQGTEAQGRQMSAWQNPYVTAEIGRLRDAYNNDMTYDFRVTQPLYFPGKQSKHEEIFAKQAEMQKIQMEDLAELLSLEATYFAYAYSIAERRAAHSKDRIRRMSLMRTYMRSHAYASPAKIIQRNIVSNQLITLQKLLNQELATVEGAWQKLNIYLNQEDKVRVVTPWLNELRDINIVDYINDVRVGNRRLKAKHMQIASLEADVSYQKRVPLPDISVTAFYRKEALIIPGANNFYGGAVTVPIPVLNANRAGVEAAEKRLAAERSEQNFMQREVLQLARAAHTEYMQKKQLLNVFKQEQIASIEKQMRYADHELKLGRIDLISYLEMELKMHEALVSYYDNQLELVRVITQMIGLLGDSVRYKGDLYVFQNY